MIMQRRQVDPRRRRHFVAKEEVASWVFTPRTRIVQRRGVVRVADDSDFLKSPRYRSGRELQSPPGKGGGRKERRRAEGGRWNCETASGWSRLFVLPSPFRPLPSALLKAVIFAQAVKTAFPLRIVKTRDFLQTVNLHGPFFRCFLSTLVYFIYVAARIDPEELTRDRQKSDRQDQQRQAFADPA